jgi:putative transposase
MCRAGSMTACRSCAGSTTGAISLRHVAISRPGSPNGQANTPSSPAGSKRRSDETLTFYRLPPQHHKHLKSTNMLERLNEEIKRRTHVVRIFPNGESCLRLVRALAVETHENWLEQHRYLNMDDLREHKKEVLRHTA